MLLSLFSWLGNNQQIRALVLRAEMIALDLNKLPAANPPQDMVGILQTTCVLLQRLVERQESRLEQANTFQKQPTASFGTPTASASEQSSSTTKSASATTKALSATAIDLMKLSDWVLLAKAGSKPDQPTVLEEIYCQLTNILAKERVTILAESGPCDYERQMVVGMKPTDYPHYMTKYKVRCLRAISLVTSSFALRR